MTQEEKIKAYLLNQLSPDETAAFKEEIGKDPELTTEVTATKLLLLAKEMKYREELREKMKKWQSEEPIPSPPPGKSWGQKYGLPLVAGVIAIVFAAWGINYWQSINQSGVDLTKQERYSVAEKDTVTDTIAGAATPALVNNQRLAKFSNAIIEIRVEKMGGVIMAGTGKKSLPNVSNKPETGFILSKNHRQYVITNANSVRHADWSDSKAVTGITADSQRMNLKLIGKDELYDIAVLSIEKSATAAPKQAVLFSNEAVQKEDVVFLASQQDKKQAFFEEARVQKTDGAFLRVITNTPENAEGPILNADGAVVGMFSQYASSLSPDDRYKKYALSTEKVSAIIDEILISKGKLSRTYAGIAFSTNKMGNVIINSLIEGSPASTESYLIGQEVKSINKEKITSLYHVAEALRKVKPDSSFLLIYSTNGTDEKEAQIWTKEMGDPDLEMIAKKIINSTGTIKYERSSGNPLIRYKEKTISDDNFVVEACQIGNNPRWRAVDVTADFGTVLRHIGLAGQGFIKVYNKNNYKDKKSIPVKLLKPILCN